MLLLAGAVFKPGYGNQPDAVRPCQGDGNTCPDVIIMQKLLLMQPGESAEEILLKEQNTGSPSGLWLESAVVFSEVEKILPL